MFATAGDAVEAMRGQLQTLAGARARANMFVDESDLVHHFRMQESKAGHVSRADFAKVLVQVFPTLPLAASPAALDELASQFAVDSTTMPQGQQQLVPFHMFVYELFNRQPTTWHIADKQNGGYARDERHRGAPLRPSSPATNTSFC